VVGDAVSAQLIGVTAGRDVIVAGQVIHAIREPSWPVRVGIPPAVAHCYQARPQTQQLADAARYGQTAVLTQVLTGLGGVGKTQLAAAYARSTTMN